MSENTIDAPAPRESLARIARDDATLRAWVHVAASAPDSTNAEGPLANVAFGVKDIIDVRAMPTRLGIELDAAPARIDAWCVAALRAAGAVPIGKTHTTAFAWRDPAPTCNPHAAHVTPGGSSAGSAAAVAAGHVAFALGTQTIGSTLRPAAFCGVVGYKPTYGTVPVYGTSPLSPSVDHIGVIAKDVATAQRFAAVFDIDADFFDAPPHFGFADGAFADRIGAEVMTALEECVRGFGNAGARIDRRRMPDSFFAAYDWLDTLIAFEAYAVNSPWLAHELPPLIAELLRRGATLPHSARTSALAFRGRTRSEIDAALAPFDAVLLPVADVAPDRGSTGDSSPLAPATFYGFPAITIPIGRARAGLPMGVQLIAPHGRDARLLAAAAWLERSLAGTRT